MSVGFQLFKGSVERYPSLQTSQKESLKQLRSASEKFQKTRELPKEADVPNLEKDRVTVESLKEGIGKNFYERLPLCQNKLRENVCVYLNGCSLDQEDFKVQISDCKEYTEGCYSKPLKRLTVGLAFDFYKSLELIRMGTPKDGKMKYRVQERLGEFFGSIRKATALGDEKTQVVIKACYHKSLKDETEMSIAASKASNLAVKVVDSYEYQSILRKKTGKPITVDALVLEHLEGQDLFITLYKSGAWPLKRVKDFAVKICYYLKDIQKIGMVHADLKPENFMISGEVITVIDHGVSFFTDMEFDPYCQTKGYRCPSVFLGENVNKKADFFGLACVLFEAYTGSSLFFEDLDELITHTQHNKLEGNENEALLNHVLLLLVNAVLELKEDAVSSYLQKIPKKEKSAYLYTSNQDSSFYQVAAFDRYLDENSKGKFEGLLTKIKQTKSFSEILKTADEEEKVFYDFLYLLLDYTKETSLEEIKNHPFFQKHII